ncbi:MAG: iron-sulfur cluster assembly protein [Monoraphidium minutum]|nr:MAG: iron-sulfur cluster assembly protein [Monoraphidium minutum]
MQGSAMHRGARSTGLGSRPAVGRRAPLAPRASAAAVATQVEDKWLAKNVAPLAAQEAPAGLAALRSSCVPALATLRVPTTRNEEYRFTDVAALTAAALAPAPAGAVVDAGLLERLHFPEAQGSTLVLVDGRLRPELSDLSALPAGVYVGPATGAPAEVLQRVGELSNARGGPFAVVNGVMAQDVLVVSVPARARIERPLYVVHVASAAAPAAGGGERTLSACAPRLLIALGKGAEAEVVEEYVSAAEGAGDHAVFAVAEVQLDACAALRHGYVQREAAGSVHFKATLVEQGEGSSYTLNEARVGSGLSRHDVGVAQGGPETATRMRHFLLAGASQLQDLHTKLVLDHPRGEADQLHKCIVSHATGRGVFDGNVKVNRMAQKTDAGQLSRNLLLVPRATVNIKPNLQIIADDVKCTHGAAISDLSEEELFYFRARGIPAEVARQSLVYSFGAEVVQALKYERLVQRIQADVVAALQVAEAVITTK